MTPDTTIDIPAHVVARELDGETILLDLESGVYFGLDNVGARAWSLLAEGRSLAEACDVITNEYDVARDTVEQDLAELCDTLFKQNLIVEKD